MIVVVVLKVVMAVMGIVIVGLVVSALLTDLVYYLQCPSVCILSVCTID